MKWIFLTLLIFTTACSSNRHQFSNKGRASIAFNLSDTSGQFKGVETSLGKAKGILIAQELKFQKETVQKIGHAYRLTQTIYRPVKSEFTVYLPGESRKTLVQIDKNDRGDIYYTNTEQKISFSPKSKLRCFFSTLLRCLSIMKVEERKRDPKIPLRIDIIFDGYPFIFELFGNIQPVPMVTSTVELDGKNLIIDIFDSEMVVTPFKQLLWPAHGMQFTYKEGPL